ncbi:phage Gp37/Gp68 family protein [Burkholderia dolosa]|uniref:Phage Gp37/Gp68 family protein n=1 Tax=Burkholderia dolosa TaxID=152500 RepID=A0A892I7U0_9BURK|nr:MULTISPECIES: phage Gp37/Gp68 family protein [Burkholderia]AKE03813.1 phage Gp37Gp68 [Burkholderia cepacia]AJY12607.1 phage Gp37/Gp68 family protein [Burkholderia dolosa AU0158]AYZ98578.1 phage Gp37/Gp68 family protein [Burkholderia dolosa]MBR8418980.1 phage Gp37/Gp68 family protein [Burkholderia dolosa]MBY4658509.1 phage Gp37/Gp68 family protein [Burkholderia dolosa]
MSENTKIEWCDHTFNPWEGCQKVGPGCDHCYAETRNARFAGGTAVNWGPGAPRRRTSSANWRKPLAWNAAHAEFFAAHGRRQRVFCASLADVFDNAVSPIWRADLFELIKRTPHLDWLLLTKRIGNAREMIQTSIEFLMDADREWPWPNVWLGATIVNQTEADRDIPKLLAVTARVHFLSMEPLIGPVDLTSSGAVWSDMNGNIVDAPSRGLRSVDWVIVGGESGPHARPMHPDWARSLRDQCAAAGVPFLFKQWGEWAPAPEVIDASGTLFHRFTDGVWMQRIGKRAAGRLLDVRTHDQFPAVPA